MQTRFFRIRSSLASVLLAAGVLIHLMPPTRADDISARIGAAGVGRFNAGQWGLVGGTFRNQSDQPRQITTVITHGTKRTQFVRTLVVPPETSRHSSWPVLIDQSDSTAFLFDYIVLDGDQNSQNIRQSITGEPTDSFSSANAAGSKPSSLVTEYAPGYCGVLVSEQRMEFPQDLGTIEALTDRLRSLALQLPMILPLSASDLNGYAEALEPLEQLIVVASDLHRHPDACEAIREWVQRGGRALIMLPQCGEDTARAVLGDVMPLSVVDRTTQMTVSLEQNPAQHASGAMDESHVRQFLEPVTIVRTLIEGGNVIWSVDNWPVVVETSFGDGGLIVVAMSPELLQDPERTNGLDPSAHRISERIFNTQRADPILQSAKLATAAEKRIGYVIPARALAAGLLAVFTLALGVLGWLLWKKDRPLLHLLSVPALALLAAVPGIVQGNRSRNVAPPTLIEHRIANITSGQTVFAADGVATLYHPSVTTAGLSFSPGTTLNPPKTASAGQRLIWTDRANSHWTGFSQPAGATSYSERSIVRIDGPLTALGRLSGDGIHVTLLHAESLQPEHMLLAGSGPDQMAVRELNGEYFAGSSDVLAPNQTSNQTLLSDLNVQRSQLYREIFDERKSRLQRFPGVASLMFWTDKIPSAVKLDDDLTRFESSTVVVLPLEVEKPGTDTLITIPPVLLPYRVIADVDGAVSSNYNARMGMWLEKKTASTTVLQFDLPEAVRPFRFEDSEVLLRIRAGSRNVKIEAGRLSDLTEIKLLNSPVENIRIPIEAAALNKNTKGDSVLLRISVGELLGVAEDDQVNAERDDFWMIERVLLTVKGRRLPEVEIP